MFFEHELNLGQDLNLDQPVNDRFLLSVVSKLSIFALHTNDLATRLERMGQTTRIMYALCHFEEGNNRETLHYICEEIYKNGEEIASKTGDKSQLNFSLGFKAAINILDVNGMKFSEQWKISLITKLNETRKMIRTKARSVEEKIKSDQNPDGSEFSYTHKKNKHIV